MTWLQWRDFQPVQNRCEVTIDVTGHSRSEVQTRLAAVGTVTLSDGGLRFNDLALARAADPLHAPIVAGPHHQYVYAEVSIDPWDGTPRQVRVVFTDALLVPVMGLGMLAITLIAAVAAIVLVLSHGPSDSAAWWTLGVGVFVGLNAMGLLAGRTSSFEAATGRMSGQVRQLVARSS